MNSLDRIGAHDFPLVVLFGVVMAFAMAFLFIILYDQQLNMRVDEQASALADDLARVAFTSLSGGQPVLNLPRDVGGSPYAIDILENSIFVVRITGGRGSGATYNAVVNAKVKVEDMEFSPGGKAYFMRSGDWIIVSAAPIKAPIENLFPTQTSEPPKFYHFAKENSKVAVAIAASYFLLIKNYGAVDVTAYFEDQNNILVKTEGNISLWVRVTGIENDENVGNVDSAWVVTEISIESPGPHAQNSCPSIENAIAGGWFYTPSYVLDHLRSRTWRRTRDNVVVPIPSDAMVRASAATTNVSTYPTWRVEWRSDEYYIIHFQAMPWWEDEPVEAPGFVFQSSPELYPMV